MEQLKLTSEQQIKQDQSSIEGTASYAIVNWWGAYDFYSATPAVIYDELLNIIPPSELEQQSVITLLSQVQKAKDLESAVLSIGNFVLRGDHESVLRGSKRFPK